MARAPRTAGGNGATTAGPRQRPGHGDEALGQCPGAETLLLFVPWVPVLVRGCAPSAQGVRHASPAAPSQARPLPRRGNPPQRVQAPVRWQPLKPRRTGELGRSHTSREKAGGA